MTTAHPKRTTIMHAEQKKLRRLLKIVQTRSRYLELETLSTKKQEAHLTEKNNNPPKITLKLKIHGEQIYTPIDPIRYHQ